MSDCGTGGSGDAAVVGRELATVVLDAGADGVAGYVVASDTAGERPAGAELGGAGLTANADAIAVGVPADGGAAAASVAGTRPDGVADPGAAVPLTGGRRVFGTLLTRSVRAWLADER
jgi:hypothetical protein